MPATGSLNELARKGLGDLWQRSAKIAIPVGGIAGFVSDVLAPLGPFVAILASVAASFCAFSGLVWFGFKRRQIRKAMEDGKIDAQEFEKIRSVNGWSVSFAFSFVAAIVLFTFFGAQKAIALQEPERGFFANAMPGIAELQKQLLGLEERTQRIDVTTQRLEAKTDGIAQAIEKLDSRVAAIAPPPESGADREAAPKTLCEPHPGLSQYAKVYLAPDLIAESVSVKEKNQDGLHDIHLRIRGPAAEAEGIESKVVRYRAVAGYYGGTDYLYSDGSEDKTRLIHRKNHEGDTYRLFVEGRPFDVKLDSKRSKEFCASALSLDN